MLECPLLTKYGIAISDTCSDNPKKDWVKSVCLYNCPLGRCIYNMRRVETGVMRILALTTLTTSILRQRDRNFDEPQSAFWR